MIPLQKCCADFGVPFSSQGYCVGHASNMQPGDYLINMTCSPSMNRQEIFDAMRDCWLEHEGIDVIPCIRYDQGTVSE